LVTWCGFILVFASAIEEDRFARAIRTWPTVPGTVIEAGQIVNSRRHRVGGKPVTSVRIKYRYSVDDHEFIGNRYSVTNRIPGRDVREPYVPKSLGPDYAEGKEVQVHSDPANPEDSILRADGNYASPFSFILLLAPALAIAWSIGTWVQFRKWQRARKRSQSSA
jgi:hypothetical protein